jgi:hypothetical protein
MKLSNDLDSYGIRLSPLTIAWQTVLKPAIQIVEMNPGLAARTSVFTATTVKYRASGARSAPKPRGGDGIAQRDQETTHSARARLDKHRWLRDRHLAAATPTWKQSSATEHSMVARDDGTVNTDSGVNSERS